MADGTTTPISDIDLGDKVLATDPDTGETTSQTVTTLWIHDDTVINLELDNGATITITTTTDHPFWNHTDQQWQPAEALDTGDHLLTITSENITVDGINPAAAHTETAYNLTIRSIHTYYVLAGNTPLLAHNTDSGCNIPLPTQKIGPTQRITNAQAADLAAYNGIVRRIRCSKARESLRMVNSISCRILRLTSVAPGRSRDRRRR